MEKALVLVESPAKARTIGKYLGPKFEVMASVGHVMDLPPKSMGVDIESGDFTPEYEPILGKAKVISEIKKKCKKVDSVFLAPDPDREGEAIAFHLATIIKDAKKIAPNIKRVRFHELTKKAIVEAFSHAGELNSHLFDAQQARRILDRLVGYKISPLLWKKVQRGLSAGRVQSVAVKLVVNREKEIEVFIKKEYWTIEAKAKGKIPPDFLVKLFKIDGKKAEVDNEKDALLIKSAIEGEKAVIADVIKKSRSRKPIPPFITSKLQQDAARAFRFSTKQTMRIAQSLYEGIDVGSEGAVGLITYMRTDSTKVSNDAITSVRDYISQNFGKEYLPKNPNMYQSGKSAQEAHEAIRPTNLSFTPDLIRKYLKPEEFKLYQLIFNRFVASQMMPALYDQTTIDVLVKEYTLRATGSILRFAGFLKAYQEQLDEDDENAKKSASDETVTLPDLNKGDEVKLSKIKAEQHFTQPPPRFSEASLVKELEEKGIGRPSTYASIMSVILDKGYTQKDGGRFYPTELGRVVTELLDKNFPEIMSVEFTAGMEEKLDRIEEGEAKYVDTLREFYSSLQERLEKAQNEMTNIKRLEEKTDVPCEKCGAETVIKWGKNGSFLGCSKYPDCDFTSQFERVEGSVKLILPKEVKDIFCPQCSSLMKVKRGKFGEFLGCSRFPDCNTTMPMPLGVKCPSENCKGDVVQKRSKTGRAFFGCNNYPTCTFVSWNKPINRTCESCEFNYMVEKNNKLGLVIFCPRCKATVLP